MKGSSTVEILSLTSEEIFIPDLEVKRSKIQLFYALDILRVLDGFSWTFSRNPLIVDRLKIVSSSFGEPLSHGLFLGSFCL